MSYSKGIEALAQAIAAFSGYRDPGSDLFQANNPGGLKASSPDHARDFDDNRVFRSFLDGWQALLHDVEVKLTRPDSRAKLEPNEHVLVDLARCFVFHTSNKTILERYSRKMANAWAEFLRKALQDPEINQNTKLERFLK